MLITIMANTIPMDSAAQLRLMTWLSPAFPVGAYAYSHGLETAIERGWVRDRNTLKDWLEDLLEHGAPRNDAILIVALYADMDLAELNELALAFLPSCELRAESTNQGGAFLKAVSAAWPDARFAWTGEIAYPVAVANAGRCLGVPLAPLVTAYLHAFVANLTSAAIRAVPLGQSDGIAILAAFEPLLEAACRDALVSTIDDLGGAVMLSDIASMNHETQYTRLFRS